MTNIFENIFYFINSQVKQEPQFLELNINDPEIPEYLRTYEKKFWVKCIALGKSAIEGGPTKKSAQHSAAGLVIRKIQRKNDDSDSDDEPVSYNREDYVTELMNLCVLKNYHKPQFACIDSYGKDHERSFIYECRLDSIVRTATAETKNKSKQMAAKAVLDIVKSVKIQKILKLIWIK